MLPIFIPWLPISLCMHRGPVPSPMSWAVCPWSRPAFDLFSVSWSYPWDSVHSPGLGRWGSEEDRPEVVAGRSSTAGGSQVLGVHAQWSELRPRCSGALGLPQVGAWHVVCGQTLGQAGHTGPWTITLLFSEGTRQEGKTPWETLFQWPLAQVPTTWFFFRRISSGCYFHLGAGSTLIWENERPGCWVPSCHLLQQEWDFMIPLARIHFISQ